MGRIGNNRDKTGKKIVNGQHFCLEIMKRSRYFFVHKGP